MNNVTGRIATILDHAVLDEMSEKELAELKRELWYWHSKIVELEVKREAARFCERHPKLINEYNNGVAAR